MATLGMRHAVLWVSDPKASADFYTEALGLEVKNAFDGGAFLSSPNSTTDHDLGLFRSDEKVGGKRNTGLYHIAWEVATLAELVEAKERLTRMGALVGENNHGMSRSLYCQDPDGIEFEVMWQVPVHLQTEADELKTTVLDLAAEIERFGGQTQSGTLTAAPS